MMIDADWSVLFYKDGTEWKPVAATTEYSVNRVTFTPVTTTALRLEVQLQPHFSGGILEWRMKE